ncbi:patatin-like phospholipase family protein [Thiomicrorhabdus sp. ZW0627]|uniref:patatin-like phospholipase family protein n=1 Tax=Thiomicrorhabdus sp. ZW0627 TaxID=3039774 RepID=UPI0024373BFC|nr:patatin-like phospholipase family protein [Thiomicrorhabdus sp. ZW0627]MDG6774374.1 patatin-like phospholipase family protein [Thiomicrorhabdus sp. ZW0627]
MTKAHDKLKNKKSVSLILGSGGARGLAHIGIIRWLEEQGYEIRFVSGSSMGALVGGVYAAGKLDEFVDWFKKLTNTDILALTDLAWDRSGLIKGDKLFETFKDLIGDPNIEDLPIPFTAVATDIENEKEVWLQTGSLLKAIRASISLPMIFTPYHLHGMTLIDGGVLNPMPIAPTFSQNNDLSIAVDLAGTPIFDSAKPMESEEDIEEDSWLNDITGLFGSLKERFLSKDKTDLGRSFNLDVYEVSNMAFDSMQNTIARQKLAAYPPDITIEIPRNACGMMEFTKVNEMIALGYRMAQETLGE